MWIWDAAQTVSVSKGGGGSNCPYFLWHLNVSTGLSFESTCAPWLVPVSSPKWALKNGQITSNSVNRPWVQEWVVLLSGLQLDKRLCGYRTYMDNICGSFVEDVVHFFSLFCYLAVIMNGCSSKIQVRYFVSLGKFRYFWLPSEPPTNTSLP